MKRGVWVGGLVLSVVGWTTASGQEAWRPGAARPAAESALNELKPCPAATLGRPVALDPAPATPEAASSGVVTASYREPGGGPSLSPRPAGGPPFPVMPDDEGDAPGERATLFAIDRLSGDSDSTLRLAGLTAPAVLGGTTTKTPAAAGPAQFPGVASDCASGNCNFDSDDKPRFYVSGEYLYWWLKQDKTPVLATTSQPQDDGFLGKPTTQILYGGDGYGGQGRSGFRGTAGYWLDWSNEEAIEISGFFLQQSSTDFMASSSQYPVIARPFFNLNSGTEYSEITTFPGLATGNIQIHSMSQLWGAEANLKCNICCGCDYRIDVFGGFRYIYLDESLGITENVLGLPGSEPLFANQRITVNDSFATRNQFYGGQGGINAEWNRGRWSLDVKAKLGLGDTHQEVAINGSQHFVSTTTGAVSNAVGGLLALTSNIGNYNRDKFSVVPELGLNIGYQLTDHVRAYVGYNVLYWTNVVRPGEQIDRVIDITKIPNFPVPGTVPTGMNRPAPTLTSSDLWVQGVNVGLEIRY